jgi:hypothetical protein
MANTLEQKERKAEKMRQWRAEKKAALPQEQRFVAVNSDAKPRYEVSDRLDERTKRIYEQVSRGCERGLPLIEIERRILALNSVRRWYPESTVRCLVRTGFDFFADGEEARLSDDDIFDNCE